MTRLILWETAHLWRYVKHRFDWDKSNDHNEEGVPGDNVLSEDDVSDGMADRPYDEKAGDKQKRRDETEKAGDKQKRRNETERRKGVVSDETMEL